MLASIMFITSHCYFITTSYANICKLPVHTKYNWGWWAGECVHIEHHKCHAAKKSKIKDFSVWSFICCTLHTSGQQWQLQLHKHVPPATLYSIQLFINSLSLLNILQCMAAERAWKVWRHRWVKVLSRPSNCATVTHHCLWLQEFSSQSLKLARVSIISHWLNRLLSGPWHRQSVSSCLSFEPQSIITQMHRLVTKDRGSTLRTEEYYCLTHKQIFKTHGGCQQWKEEVSVCMQRKGRARRVSLLKVTTEINTKTLFVNKHFYIV